MSKRLSEGLAGFNHLVERQMLLHDERRKLVRRHTAAQLQSPCNFVTISRDIGSMGSAIASEIARRLQWKVYDKEIVDYIAKHSNIRHSLVAQLDEQAQSIALDSVERWLSVLQGHNSNFDEYHVALIRALASLAAQGRSVILGHGGAYALQGQAGLHVRITASLPVRIHRVSAVRGSSYAETRKLILRTDAARREFIQHHFRPGQDDIRHFHMVFNTDSLPADSVVAAIVGMVRHGRQQGAGHDTAMYEEPGFQDSRDISV